MGNLFCVVHFGICILQYDLIHNSYLFKILFQFKMYINDLGSLTILFI